MIRPEVTKGGMISAHPPATEACSSPPTNTPTTALDRGTARFRGVPELRGVLHGELRGELGIAPDGEAVPALPQ